MTEQNLPDREQNKDKDMKKDEMLPSGNNSAEALARFTNTAGLVGGRSAMQQSETGEFVLYKHFTKQLAEKDARIKELEEALKLIRANMSFKDTNFCMSVDEIEAIIKQALAEKDARIKELVSELTNLAGGGKAVKLLYGYKCLGDLQEYNFEWFEALDCLADKAKQSLVETGGE